MIVRSRFPGRTYTGLKKSRRFLRLFALSPKIQLHPGRKLGLGLNDCSFWCRATSLLAAALGHTFRARKVNYCSVFRPDAPVSSSFVHIDLVESANYCSVICPDLSGIRCRDSVSGFGVGVRCRNDCPVASFSVVFCRFS